MARWHGIESDTYSKFILDSGAIYTDFVSLAEPGTLLGATRGGAVFKRSPSYKDTPYEGIPGQVVGQKHLVGVKVTLDINIISFDRDNLALALPNSAVSSLSESQLQITEASWDAAGVHTLSNIAIIAQLSGSDTPIVIVLDNPISEKDLDFSFKDKGEVVSKWTFSAFYKESTGFSTPPWRILWPKAVAGIAFVAVNSVTADTGFSLDGITWSLKGPLPATVGYWRSVIFGGTRYAAVAFGDTVGAYSDDGESWTSFTLPAAKNWNSLAYGNNLYVVVNAGDAAGAYSSDGVTWAATTLPAAAFGYSGAAYGLGLFVAVGFGISVAAYSSDAITWQSGTLPSATTWFSVAFGNNTFVAIANNSTAAAYSTDGINWVASTLPSSIAWSKVAYGNGKFLAIAKNTTVYAYSTDDGATWQAGALPVSKDWRSLTYGNGVFVILPYGDTTALYSADGLSWTQTPIDSRNWVDVIY